MSIHTYIMRRIYTENGWHRGEQEKETYTVVCCAAACRGVAANTEDAAGEAPREGKLRPQRDSKTKMKRIPREKAEKRTDAAATYTYIYADT